MWFLYLDESGNLEFDFEDKINLSVPYRLLASGLMPTYRREHPEQPATGLPLLKTKEGSLR